MLYRDLEQCSEQLPKLAAWRDVLQNPLPLILDRTADDLSYVQRLFARGWEALTDEEKDWWLNAVQRASIGAEALNRIGLAMNMLARRLREAGYPVRVVEREDWQPEELRYQADLAKMLKDLRQLRAAIAQFETTPEVPEGHFSIAEANAVEQIIADVWELLGLAAAGAIYSGEIFGGEM